MNKKQYEAKRSKLMNEVESLINDGKIDEANSKMNEVNELDAQWDAIAQATANFNALNVEPQGMQPVDISAAFGKDQNNSGESDIVKTWKSEKYKNAWAKTMMGKPLTLEENEAYKMVNEAYTHTTKNTGVVIPESVANGIWEIAGEYYPYFADITKTHVNGVFSMIQEDTSSDAKWYEEETETEDGKEMLKEFTLNGCELSRTISVSWKLKEMAIEDFIPYIQRKMAKKMGAAAGYGATHGAGPKATDGKPEPYGTVTVLESETGTPQIVEYNSGTVPTYKDIILTRSKIKSGYGAGLCVYANSTTIWTKLAAITDNNGRPLFVTDVTGQGAFRILGMIVKEDASMKNGEILMSNAQDGYICNINKEVAMMTEEHVKKRKTEYCGYAILDGNTVTTKAHALLKEKAATETKG